MNFDMDMDHIRSFNERIIRVEVGNDLRNTMPIEEANDWRA